MASNQTMPSVKASISNPFLGLLPMRGLKGLSYDFVLLKGKEGVNNQKSKDSGTGKVAAILAFPSFL